MTKPVSTFRILKEKSFNSDIDEYWVDWAYEMMQAGFEADSLYQLAGISKPYNQFELQDLTNRVLKDLDLDYSDKEKTLNNYIYYLLSSNIDKTDKYYDTLKEFRDIYYELDMESKFQDFAFLYWAKDDLIYSDYQHYWDGADRTNIDNIIREHFAIWITEYEAKNNISTNSNKVSGDKQ